MDCCEKGHEHHCKDCKHVDVDMFAEPCQKCIACNPHAYALQGDCAFEAKEKA
jgi:hypothetical protein